MTRLLFDTECDGLLDILTKIHSLVIKDFDTGEVLSCTDQSGYTPIAEGLKRLSDADEIIGHNAIKFDVPALKKVYPEWTYRGRVADTLVLARCAYPSLDEWDHTLLKAGKLPGKLFGAHKLEAWGYRLGILKGHYADHNDPDRWKVWTPDMQTYCEQDVEVLHTLYAKLLAKKVPQAAIDLEHEVMWLVAQMERNGFPFDIEKATALYAKLSQRRTELAAELKEAFGSWWNAGPERELREARRWVTREWGHLTRKGKKGEEPKRGYYETTGGAFWDLDRVTFNPASRKHISERLRQKYGWEPTEWTPSGEPKVDETVLSGIEYPEAKLLSEYFLVEKRIGAIAEGNQAWLKLEISGKMHGNVNPLGTVTGRATHSNPNMSQVPSCSAPYGKECRELFHVPTGWKLLGVDLKGLELRCLAHFMAIFDGGEYAKIVVSGDPHTENQHAAGLYLRNSAKTLISMG